MTALPHEPLEIVLIEDNPTDAELTIRALKKNNLINHVKWIKDGAAAVEYLFEHYASGAPAPKVILLDLKLPKIDGHEILQRLKNDERTQPIPVVVLTSSREEADIMRTYKKGANSYIVKPVDFNNFSAAVSQLGMYWMLLNQSPEKKPEAK